MNIIDLIRKKRDGHTLTKEEIEFFANAAADDTIADYQVSAMLMAMYLNGLNESETLDLTLAMAQSGDMADLSGIEGIKGDKHSTGGVGDKTTLIVAPIVSECGIKVAKMSGRGLGHTGGTVDKLESIPGFKTSLSSEEFTQAVNRCGLCVAGQSGRLCPADKKLYALRDLTATVDNIPLIASSIMSKKLAGGADCIVLDVKCGSGAFMKDRESAVKLAEKMVEIGKGAGRKIAALITDMNVPLGNYIGNSLEIVEAVETLKGNGPSDLTEISVLLSAKLLQLAEKGSFDECKKLAYSKITDGSALNKLAEMVKAQGGNPDYIFNSGLFPKAEHCFEIKSEKDGYIGSMDTEGIGSVCVLLGAGRMRKEDSVDSTAGIILCKKTGDYVKKGETLATLYASKNSLFEAAAKRFAESVSFESGKTERNPILLEIIE